MEYAYKGNIPKQLEEIYDRIVERFPAGTLPAIILNDATPQFTEVIRILKEIAAGGGQDFTRYKDEESKKDAQSFIDALNKYDQSLLSGEEADSII